MLINTLAVVYAKRVCKHDLVINDDLLHTSNILKISFNQKVIILIIKAKL